MCKNWSGLNILQTHCNIILLEFCFFFFGWSWYVNKKNWLPTLESCCYISSLSFWRYSLCKGQCSFRSFLKPNLVLSFHVYVFLLQRCHAKLFFSSRMLCLVLILANRWPGTAPPSLKTTQKDVTAHRKSCMYIQNFIYGIQCIKHSVSSQSKCSIHWHRGRKCHRKKMDPAFCIYHAVLLHP